MACLIAEGRTDLIEKVHRGECTAGQALNRDRDAKRKARGRNNDEPDPAH